jgi:hypothetical protein
MESTLKVADLPAGRGFGWITRAFHLFRRKPFAWIGLCAGWLVVTFGLLLLPLIGGAIANFLQPVFFASFAMTARKQDGGGEVLMGDLFIGFKRNARPLILLGAILLLAEGLIIMLLWLLGLPMGGGEGEKAITMVEYVEQLKGKEWILAVGFILTALVKGALWFAPQLIAFHDMPTSHAIRWSVYAALSNLGAMISYGMLLFLLFFVGLMPWALGLLVVIPLMVISTYFGYEEVFIKPPAGAAVTPP